MVLVIFFLTPAELITAKHIVLKELFTLKKVCISHKKTLARYHGVMNESKPIFIHFSEHLEKSWRQAVSLQMPQNAQN